MPNNQELLHHIAERQERIDKFIRRNSPRMNRLSRVCIVSSALAALMTVGPAAGGSSFISIVQGLLDLPKGEFTGRLLCLVAMIVSVIAAISANMNKSSELPIRIKTSETSLAELDGLAMALQFDKISLGEAINQFVNVVENTAFVDNGRRVPAARTAKRTRTRMNMVSDAHEPFARAR